MKIINVKNRPREIKKEIINKQNNASYLFKNLFKNLLKILFVTLFFIAFFRIMAVGIHDLFHGYSRVLKDYSSFINRYESKDRIELVDAKHIMFDKETYPNADKYYNALMH